ncbi:hypothetical protein ACRAQ6_00820 [Erythrobacter sp. HA6-11]
MSFAALEYVWSTITVWHLLVLIAFLAIIALPWKKSKGDMPFLLRLHAGFLASTGFYFIASLAIGQVFGAKFDWSSLWPSCFAASSLFATWVLFPTMAAACSKRSLDLLAFSVFATLLAVVFFGFGLSAMLWAVPRIIGFGVIDFPQYSWAVQI